MNIGFRYFILNGLMFDIGIGQSMTQTEAYIILVNGGSGGTYSRIETDKIGVTLWGSLNLVQELGSGYLYEGVGLGILGNGVVPFVDPAKQMNDLLKVPFVRVGYEFRIQERVGITIFAQYLLSNTDALAEISISGNSVNYRFFSLNPLSFTLVTAFYF